MLANGLNSSLNHSHNGNINSYALQDSSHHSSGSERQVGQSFLSLTRNISLEQQRSEYDAAAAVNPLDAGAPARSAAVAAANGSNSSGAGVTKISDSFVIELPKAAAAAGQAARQRSLLRRHSAEHPQRAFNLGGSPAAVVPAGTPFAAAGAPAISSKGKRMMRSGHLFSLSALNVFGVYIGK
jgi:hypothetical protein